MSFRSRGTAKAAVQKIRSDHIVWADVILVMGDKHRQRTMADFPGEEKFKPMHELDIPDDYQSMDDELVELIRSALEPVLWKLTKAIEAISFSWGAPSVLRPEIGVATKTITGVNCLHLSSEKENSCSYQTRNGSS